MNNHKIPHLDFASNSSRPAENPLGSIDVRAVRRETKRAPVRWGAGIKAGENIAAPDETPLCNEGVSRSRTALTPTFVCRTMASVCCSAPSDDEVGCAAPPGSDVGCAAQNCHPHRRKVGCAAQNCRPRDNHQPPWRSSRASGPRRALRWPGALACCRGSPSTCSTPI